MIAAGSVVGFLMGVVGMSAAVPAPGHQGSTSAPPIERQVALGAFQQRLDDYVRMRARLLGEIQPLSPTANASELTSREHALAAALRESRKTAKQGDLIPTEVAGYLRTIVAADFQQRSAAARQAAFEDGPPGLVLVVNRRYPAQEALPTVPPLLLAKLPVLPDDLQYRLVGRHLVLLDGDTQLIIDYVSNVLPSR